MKTVSLLVNQKPVQIEADPEMPLLWVIPNVKTCYVRVDYHVRGATWLSGNQFDAGYFKWAFYWQLNSYCTKFFWEMVSIRVIFYQNRPAVYELYKI